jgi:cytochrome c peroxidase
MVIRGIVVIALGIALASCGGAPTRAQLDADNPKGVTPSPYGMEEFFAAANHQPDPARARLGRWLFYDTRLSSDRSLSCATCHRPEFAFSEQRPVAIGIGDQVGRRKTQSLINLAARTELPGTVRDPGTTFFWDGRATSLEAQVLMPIEDSREMGMSHPAMVTRLSEISGYRPYFEEAFGAPDITLDRIASALADFVRTRKSGNSAYDRWAYGRDRNALSREQQRGSEIFFFQGGCASCHAGFNFSDGLFWNLGVGWDPKTLTFSDEGRMAVSHDSRDLGRFKTPGLRDVSKHAPYMHDGSLATLRDVVEFYSRGGNPNPGLTPRMRRKNFSPGDIDALVAFLQALDGEGYQDRPPRHFPQ